MTVDAMLVIGKDEALESNPELPRVNEERRQQIERSRLKICGQELLGIHVGVRLQVKMHRADDELTNGRKVYVGNLDPEATSTELDEIFRRYGKLSNIWVARNPPGFAFITFEDARDARDAVEATDGILHREKYLRVEIAKGPGSKGRRGSPGGRRRRGSPDGPRVPATAAKGASTMDTVAAEVAAAAAVSIGDALTALDGAATTQMTSVMEGEQGDGDE
ncbi:hypothetical protein Emag_001834 [Eimeria magna]